MADGDITATELGLAARIATYGLAVIATSIGITLLLQEESRMSSPGWQMAFALPGLNATFWGVYVTFFGLAMLAAILLRDRGRRVLGWSCIAIAVAWSGRVVASLLALEQPHASGTAPPAMLIIAGAYFMHGALYLHWLRWFSERRRRPTRRR